jgi:hypothetical protein
LLDLKTEALFVLDVRSEDETADSEPVAPMASPQKSPNLTPSAAPLTTSIGLGSRVLFTLSASNDFSMGGGHFDARKDYSPNSMTAALTVFEGSAAYYVKGNLHIHVPLLERNQKIRFNIEVRHEGSGDGAADIIDSEGNNVVMEVVRSESREIDLLNGHDYRVEVNASVRAPTGGDASHRTVMIFTIGEEFLKFGEAPKPGS